MKNEIYEPSYLRIVFLYKKGQDVHVYENQILRIPNNFWTWGPQVHEIDVQGP